MNSEHLMQIEGAPKVALGSLIETLDVERWSIRQQRD